MVDPLIIMAQKNRQSVYLMIQLVTVHFFFQTESFWGAFFIQKLLFRPSKKCPTSLASPLGGLIHVPPPKFWAQNKAKGVNFII